MAGVDAGVGKSSCFDASQKATIANNNSSGAQIASKDKNLEILGTQLKQIRLIVMGEIDEENPPSMEAVNEVVKALNAHKRAWTEMF